MLFRAWQGTSPRTSPQHTKRLRVWPLTAFSHPCVFRPICRLPFVVLVNLPRPKRNSASILHVLPNSRQTHNILQIPWGDFGSFGPCV